MLPYCFKEFLTFSDVMDYLKENNVFSYRLSISQYRNFLLSLVEQNKLTPLVYFNSVTTIITYSDKFPVTEQDCTNITEQFISGYFGIDFDTYRMVVKCDEITASYPSCNEDELQFHSYFVSSNMGVGGTYMRVNFEPYNFSPPQHKTLYQPNADDITVIQFNDIVYPKIELDALFETTDKKRDETAALKNELTKAQATIQKLQTAPHPRTANNAAKVIACLAELAKIDLTAPYGQTSNGKIITTAELLGIELNKDTVATWLKQAHEQTK